MTKLEELVSLLKKTSNVLRDPDAMTADEKAQLADGLEHAVFDINSALLLTESEVETLRSESYRQGKQAGEYGKGWP